MSCAAELSMKKMFYNLGAWLCKQAKQEQLTGEVLE